MDISVAATEFRFVHCIKGTGLVINNAINNVGKLIYIWSGIQLTSWKWKENSIISRMLQIKKLFDLQNDLVGRKINISNVQNWDEDFTRNEIGTWTGLIIVCGSLGTVHNNPLPIGMPRLVKTKTSYPP